MVLADGRTVARSFGALVDVLALAVDENVAGRARADGLVSVDDTGAAAAVDIIAWVCK